LPALSLLKATAHHAFADIEPCRPIGLRLSAQETAGDERILFRRLVAVALGVAADEPAGVALAEQRKADLATTSPRPPIV
ncbi:hypothetical protein SEEA0100_00045, partial [Salmonella enterica subsp. enterica serovar Anatum str. USDA 100]